VRESSRSRDRLVRRCFYLSGSRNWQEPAQFHFINKLRLVSQNIQDTDYPHPLTLKVVYHLSMQSKNQLSWVNELVKC